MDSTTDLHGGDAALPGLRRKRFLAVLLVGGGAIGVLHPEAVSALVLFVVALAAIAFWPRSRSAAVRQASEARLDSPDLGEGARSVVEALAEPCFVIDRGMVLRYQNPASSEPIGRLRLGEPIALRFRAPHLLAAIEDAILGDKRVSTALDERRGVERSFEIDILPIRPGRGSRPNFFLVVFYDRTVARQTDRIRTDFVANASHELRTPLASLTGFIETLQGPARGDPDAQERFLAIMRDQAQRMSRLIDDLLSLSRIEMKRHLPVSEPVELGAILAKVRDQLAPLAVDLDMKVELEAVSEAIYVAGEQDELIQVFANLVENACKYARSGKRIVLRLTPREERGRSMVDASVVDFGPGIAAEHLPRLTERFYRVDVGSSRAMKGTGLGLSIVRNILLRHKARLLVESEVGEGATFTARFQRMGARR